MMQSYIWLLFQTIDQIWGNSKIIVIIIERLHDILSSIV